ncbi:Hypothetical predicted protein, partial [Paramuricea clavata]
MTEIDLGRYLGLTDNHRDSTKGFSLILLHLIEDLMYTHTPPRGAIARSFLNTIKLYKDKAEPGIDCDSNYSVNQIKSTSLTRATIVNSSILEYKEQTFAIKTV